ncbi:hypothetical protein L6R46_08245 [Myxococcota bacterium]|jgi:hypothetical protein|nr:hypothetical protein [Myxococcota bacterium]
MLSSLAVLLLGLAPAEAAESVSLRYLLAVDGEVIGHRDLKINYLPSDSGELRLMESFTELTFSIAGQPYTYKQRLGGLGGGNFSSAISDNGTGREVQAVRSSLGWTVTVAEGKTAEVYALGPSAFDLTSLSLHDPAVAESLAGRSSLKVLVAETGGVMEGPLRQAADVQIKLGGQMITCDEYVWSLPEGEVRLDYGPDGHLMRYTTRVAGKVITATLDRPPPPRTYGTTMDGPLIQSSVGEETL